MWTFPPSAVLSEAAVAANSPWYLYAAGRSIVLAMFSAAALSVLMSLQYRSM
jgi:hypothetical protein